MALIKMGHTRGHPVLDADQDFLVSFLGESRCHPTMQYEERGVRFFSKVSRCSIIRTELDEPTKNMVLYDLYDTDIRPLDVSAIPPGAYPYPDCLFAVLSEPDNEARFKRLTEFFLVLGQPGDPSDSVGLGYTIMHLWKFLYGVAMSKPTPRTTETVAYFMRAGMFQCMVRILERCTNRKFLLTDYNRYVPYRILESIFAATQASYNLNDDVVNTVLEDPEKAFNIFYPMVCGQISILEEVLATQLTANFSCYPNGVVWLLDHPQLVGKVGTHIWSLYEQFFTCLSQQQEVHIPYIKHLAFTNVEVGRDLTNQSTYKPDPMAIADLCTFIVLCCMCNVCAAHPDDEPMERVEPSLLAIVKEGLFNHIGSVSYGIILNDNRYHDELTLEKFLSFLSWSCFQKETQKMAIEQLHSLPTSRHDFPLFYAKDSYSKSRSVIACLVTHSCRMDFEKGSHFTTLALIYLLKEDDDVAMELIRVAGDTLLDMAHSIYHAQMPSPEQKPISFKRMVMETILRFGGSSYFSESGTVVKPSEKRFEDPVPGCVAEAREFCERYVKEMKMKRYDKQKRVRCADEFKAEGNKFFTRKNYYSAIECYTRALAICPLTCTERRVTYYSNRAECYLKTDQSRLALRDCTKALAQNPSNLRTRWRRVQAFQNLQKRFPAALDLLTIRRHEEEAKQILGERLYFDLDQMIYELMDESKFQPMAILKHGPQVHSGSMSRKISINSDDKDNRLGLPPFRGKYYHEVFGYGRGEYVK